MPYNTPDQYPPLQEWVGGYVPEPYQKPMMLICNLVLCPWWPMLKLAESPDYSETLKAYFLTYNVILPLEAAWGAGTAEVPPLVQVVAPLLMHNAQRLLCTYAVQNAGDATLGRLLVTAGEPILAALLAINQGTKIGSATIALHHILHTLSSQPD